LIGAGALVTQGTEILAGSLVLGSPAKVVRALDAPERARLKGYAEKYVKNAAFCLEHGINISRPD
jgi:carbonic anhydrase/acetyltransferase-like protein (isoleucine patch superfamily)